MAFYFQVQRDQLESHNKHATQDHLDLACGELRETREKLKEKIIHLDRLGERVNILNEQLEDKSNGIQRQHQCKVDSLQQQHQQRIDILQRQLEQKVKTCQQQHQRRVDILQEELEQKVKACQWQLQRRVGILQERIEQKVKTCETKLAQKISMGRKIFLVCLVLGLVFLTFYLTKLEDRVQKNLEKKLRVIQILHERNVGMVKTKLDNKFDSLNTDLSNKLLILEVDTEESRIFIWKITSFEDKLTQGKNDEKRDIESVPFYAHGYKLMLRLWPNGYDVGKNTHLSISFSVMKGEYDAILPWGFSKQVTFTLIDQQDNPNQRQNVVLGLTADPNNAVFKKPVEGETRPGWGFPQFVSQNDLRTRRFVVDDTLFIKFQLDSPKSKTSWL